jgi:hypothetical protein
VRRENLVAALNVELAKISGGESGGQAKGDDAAGGGAGDEVKIVRN